MSLDTIYADRIAQGIGRWAANPGPAPEPSFSMASFLGAGGRGLPSAVLEFSGSALDAVSGFGNVLAASGGSAGGMFSVPTEAEAKQEAQARERMLRGQNASTAQGNVLRRKAEEFAPDPLTAHTADQVMHSFTRFAGKAVGSVAGLGPAGAILLGLEEGNTAAQRLRMEGVDDVTAAKVGAVQGGLSAAGVVLPLAGKTIAQTIGLVGVGGPGSYVAQEALSRKILEEAGRYDQASLHNPFDPLGLALSTVVPGAFGALHMRGQIARGKAVEAGTVPLAQLRPQELRALRYDDPRLDAEAAAAAERHGVPPALLQAIKNAGEKSNPTATSPKGARGVMQFMPATAKEMGLADPTDPVASLDAGARYLKKLHDAYGSWDAAVAHYNGGGTQAALVRSGGQPSYNETRGYLERVRKYVAEQTARDGAQRPEVVDAARVAALNDTVARSLPDTPDAMAQMQRATNIVAESSGRAAEIETPTIHPERVRIQEELQLIEEQRAELLPVAGELAERGGVREAREELAQLQRQQPDTSETATREMAKDIQHRDGVSYKTALSAAKKQMADLATDFEARVQRLNDAIERNAEAQRATQQVVELDRRQAALAKELQQLPQWAEPAPRAAGTEAAPVPRVQAPDNSLPPADSVTQEPPAPMKPAALDAALRQPEAGKPPPGKPSAAVDGAGRESGSASRGTQAPAGETKAAEPSTPTAALDAQLAQRLAVEQPDTTVVLPGTDEQIPISEALARIAEEQKQDEQWGELVQTAVTCALQG